MRKYLAAVILIFFCCSCSEKSAESVDLSAVEGYLFGSVPEYKDSDIREIPITFLTERDSLELKTTAGTRRIWQMSIIIPEVPGSDDPLKHLQRAVEKKYGLKFGVFQKITRSGISVELSRDFKRGERGCRCTFTDNALEQLARDEAALPVNQHKAAIIQAEKDILNLEYSVNSFYDETGVYPDSFDALMVNPGIKNWQGPYLKNIPNDPWGRKYQYRKTANGFIIFSTGADGNSQLHP